jgi:RluA family pseudouridine synthase
LNEPSILFEDYYLAVLHKPAGLMVEADNYDNPSVEGWYFNHLKEKFPTHKSHYIGFPHRLDRNTEGLLLVAKTKAALTELNLQFEKRTLTKMYHALVQKQPAHKNGVFRHFLKKNDKKRMAIISRNAQPDFKPCEISYEVEGATKTGFVILKINLLTGRYHQIRAQLAYEEVPVVGDKLYGSPIKYMENAIALLATELFFRHPKTAEELFFQIPLPVNTFWQV